MKQIVCHGVRSREKQLLLLYIGKVLSSQSKVVMLTQGSIVQKTMSRVFYNDNYHITDVAKVEMNEVDYIVLDIDERAQKVASLDLIEQRREDGIDLFISDKYPSDVEQNQPITKTLKDDCMIIYLNLLYDSKISASYLSRCYKIDKKTHHIIKHYHNERDMVIHLENEYNESLEMKGLSKAYLKVVTEVIEVITETSTKEVKVWLKKAIRKV